MNFIIKKKKILLNDGQDEKGNVWPLNSGLNYSTVSDEDLFLTIYLL